MWPSLFSCLSTTAPSLSAHEEAYRLPGGLFGGATPYHPAKHEARLARPPPLLRRESVDPRRSAGRVPPSRNLRQRLDRRLLGQPLDQVGRRRRRAVQALHKRYTKSCSRGLPTGAIPADQVGRLDGLEGVGGAIFCNRAGRSLSCRTPPPCAPTRIALLRAPQRRHDAGAGQLAHDLRPIALAGLQATRAPQPAVGDGLRLSSGSRRPPGWRTKARDWAGSAVAGWHLHGCSLSLPGNIDPLTSAARDADGPNRSSPGEYSAMGSSGFEPSTMVSIGRSVRSHIARRRCARRSHLCCPCS